MADTPDLDTYSRTVVESVGSYRSTLPPAVVERLGLSHKDDVEFVIDEDGCVYVRAAE